MKQRPLLFLLGVLAALAILAALSLRAGSPPNVDGGPTRTASSTEDEARGSTAAVRAKDGGFPRAIRDQAKRDELRKLLLAAATQAEAKAQAEAALADAGAGGTGGGGASPARGNRETNDIAELGRFIAQAIREDFVPMARECAKELRSRQPDAGGTALVAFELLGDPKIGGVVNEAEVLEKESSIHDAKFETCIRESLYGVYFDPPPAGGRATLRFPVTLTEGDSPIDEQVDDFHLKDKR